MRSIGASTAKAKFAQLLRRVSADGDRVVIERRGEPCAVLVPLEDLEALERQTGVSGCADDRRLRDFAEASSDYFWEMDADGRFSYFSDGLTETTGLAKEDLLGMTREEANVPDVDPEEWRRHLADLAARRSFRDFRMPRSRPDGRVVHLSVNGKAMFDDAGRFQGYRGTTSDITERVLREEALRQSEAALAQAQRQAKIGHWRWSVVENRLVSGSEEYARIHGVGLDEIEELLDQQMERVIHPDDRERVEAEFARFDETGVDYEIEYRIVRPDGEVRHVLEIGEAVLDDAGRAVEQTGTVQDITERKQAEKALADSAALLHQAAEMANLGHWVWDERELRCINCSETLAQMKGLSVDDYKAHFGNLETVYQDVHPEDRQHYKDIVVAARETKRPYDVEFREVTADGSYLYLRERGEPVLDANGNLARTVGTLQDISDYKRTEAKLQQARDELERRVEERTAELQETNRALRREIAERTQAEAVAERNRRLLEAAVEALHEGFILFDDQERLVLCNSKYREMYAPVADILQPGTPLAEIARRTARDCVGIRDEDSVEAWVRERLANFGQGTGIRDLALHGGRWVFVSENRLENGWTVGIRTDVTELKRVEQELRDSQTRLFDAIESISDGFILFDSDERLVLCNSKYHELYSDIADLLQPGARLEDLVRAAAERGQLRGVGEDVEAWVSGRLEHYRKANRSIEQALRGGRWVQATERRTCEGGIVGIRSDITRLKETMEALRQREALVRQAQQITNMGYWRWDPVEDRMTMSPELAAIYGVCLGEESDLTYEATLHRFVHPDDRARVDEAVTLPSDVGARFEVEYRLPPRDGQVRWVHEVGEVVWDELRGAVVEVGTVRDVTERKQADTALRESEDRLRQATELAGLGYVIWDSRDDTCLYCSEEYARIHGTTVADYLAKSSSMEGDWSFTHPEDVATYKAVVAKVRKGIGAELEYRVLSVAGEIRHVREIVKPVFDDKGTVVQEYATAQDITEQKRAEMALQESERDLLHRVAELEDARQMLERQGADLIRFAADLGFARDQAEAANRAKSQFLAAMSHELRTPLNAIIGFSEIIADETLGPLGNASYHDYVRDIQRSGQHLLSLINDILDLSKVETGAAELNEEALEVEETVHAALKLVAALAESNGVELRLDFQERLPALRADERKLKQVLINLLNNAVKFTEGGGWVLVKVWCQPESGFVFQIADSGIGIAADDIPKAMAQFGQVDSDLNRRFDGTGLGLPLAKGLTELHGGYLDLQSELGVGTTVTVRFPASRVIRRSDEPALERPGGRAANA